MFLAYSEVNHLGYAEVDWGLEKEDRYETLDLAKLKADIERLDAQAEKFGQVFLSEKIQKFYGDPKVQKALLDMSKRMEDEKFFK